MSNFATVVAHPQTGLVVTPSTKNPDWGTVRVDSSTTSFSNGILNKSNRVAFIRGKLVDLKGFSAGQRLVGKIIRQTSAEPFFPGQEAVVNPTTGEQMQINGGAYYQNYVFTDNVNASDELMISQNANAVTAQATPVGG